MPTCDRKPCRDIRGGGHARPAICRDPTSRILAFSRGSNLEGRWRPSNLRLRSIYLGLLTASAGQPPERYFHGWFHLRRSQSSPRRMKTIANLIVRQFLHVRFAATEIIAIVSSQPVKYIPILAFRRGIFAAVGTLSRRVIVSAI